MYCEVSNASVYICIAIRHTDKRKNRRTFSNIDIDIYERNANIILHYQTSKRNSNNGINNSPIRLKLRDISFGDKMTKRHKLVSCL